MTKNSKDYGFWASLESPDRRILILFFFWLVTILTPIIVINISSWEEDPSYFIVPVLGGLLGTFLMTGMLVFIYYYKRTIIRTRTILSWFTIFAFVLSAVTNVAIYLLGQMGYFDSSTVFLFDLNTISTYNILWQFLVLFLLAFFMQVMLMFIAFGLIWILAVVERSTISNILVDVTKITPNTSDSMLKKNKLTSGRYLALQWLFNIPDVLDTKTLTINRGKPKKKFPWKVFKTAAIWVMLLGLILTILIMYHGKSLEQISIENLVSISSLISFMTPLLILPWFIFLRLNANIKGPVRNFKLYNGLKSRMLQIIGTIGTLVMFIRLATEGLNLQQLWSFIYYYLGFLVVTIIYTFVYFNYFENDLARSIANRYRKIRSFRREEAL